MDEKKTLAYKFGYAVGYILVGCMTAVIMALTIKFIFWLF